MQKADEIRKGKAVDFGQIPNNLKTFFGAVEILHAMAVKLVDGRAIRNSKPH